MKKGVVIFIIILAVFFALPILSGSAVPPSGVGADEIGVFIAGILRYWLIVISEILRGVSLR